MAFQPPLIVQSKRITFPKAELWVPVIADSLNEAASQQINKTIRHELQKLVNDQGSLSDPRSEMLGYFELKTNEKDVLSLSLYNYAYTGGAHGLTLQKSLTFKASTGKDYTLAELFKPGSNYVARLSSLVSAQIKERNIEPLEPFTAIRPDQDFYVADRSLIIYFQLYELVPYVFGFVYFPISVYDIQDIVNENGPLGPMLVND